MTEDGEEAAWTREGILDHAGGFSPLRLSSWRGSFLVAERHVCLLIFVGHRDVDLVVRALRDRDCADEVADPVDKMIAADYV